MSTKLRQNDRICVPPTLGAQINIPDMDIRPRIRRRMPNIPTSVKAKSTSASSSPSPSRPSSSKEPPKPGSQPQLQRRNSASKTRQQSSGGARTKLPEESPEQDVRFIDVPTVQTSKSCRIQQKHIKKICPQDILEQSQESLYDRVYQVDLHAAHITLIDNLDRFTKLRVLDLSCNFIKKIDNLHHNCDLRELKLYDNDLENIENFDRLKELQHIQLQHNRIKSIGKGLQNQRRLRILRLDSNSLCHLEVRELASCAQLTSLDISNNKLDTISAVSCLPNLEELFAVNNRLRSITDLSRCRKLQEVDVSYNRLNDLSGLKGLSSLTCLHASNNQITTLSSLGKLKVLEELNLKGNKVSSVKPIVDYYPALQILDISDNHLENWQQVTLLKGLRDIAELYISGNPFCAESGAKPSYHGDLQRLLPGLDILDGAHMKKASSRPGTPLMRPMSASAVVTSRQVESQMRSLDDEMMAFEESLASRFESLRSSMAYLPTEAPSRPASAVSSIVSTPRPSSQCTKRSRIKLAQEFAAQEYESHQHMDS